MAYQSALRKDENIVELEGGGFQVEYLMYPEDPECPNEWYKGSIHSTYSAAKATIIASRIEDDEPHLTAHSSIEE